MEIEHVSEEAALAASRSARSPLGACGAPAAVEEGPDAHWAPDSLPQLPAHASTLFGDSPVARCDYSSRLLTMRDGTRLALDVHLPCGEAASAGGAPFDVVFVQSRYGRAWRLRWPYNRLWGRRPVDIVYFLFKVRCARGADRVPPPPLVPWRFYGGEVAARRALTRARCHRSPRGLRRAWRWSRWTSAAAAPHSARGRRRGARLSRISSGPVPPV